MISVSQSREMAVFNWLVNHPEIAPHVKDDSNTGKIDVSALNNGVNDFMCVEWNGKPIGFAIMIRVGDGVFEMHSGILEAYRGQRALDAGREVLKWMFLNTDCEKVTTWAWSSARHVMLMARVLGFTQSSRSSWPNTVHRETVDRVNYEQTFAEWSKRRDAITQQESPCLSQQLSHT